MKILITTPIDKSIEANPFVKVISEGLISCGNAVTCSRDMFWETPTAFDLILFQWPQDILTIEERAQQDPITISFHLQRIEKQLQFIKKAHIPIFITVHNLHPHNKSKFLNAVYDLVYSHVDCFHHMGNYSRDLMKEKYPNAYHFVVQHPTYYDGKNLGLSQNDCRKKYRLPKNKPIIIAFGAFRNNDERRLYLELNRKYKSKCCFWAPKFNRVLGINRSLIAKLISYIRYRLNGIRMNRGSIFDKDVMEMIAASDIVFIQRKDTLNSGNLPLGFSFGKIVVGPDVGNVGSILKDTGNPVFNPQDKKTLYQAMDSALKMLKNNNNQGQKNYEYAQKNMSTRIVAKRLNKEISMFLNLKRIR